MCLRLYMTIVCICTCMSLNLRQRHRVCFELLFHANLFAAAKLDGDMVIFSVKWADGFDSKVPSHVLKARSHCRLKWGEFLESKVKPARPKELG